MTSAPDINASVTSAHAGPQAYRAGMGIMSIITPLPLGKAYDDDAMPVCPASIYTCNQEGLDEP